MLLIHLYAPLQKSSALHVNRNFTFYFILAPLTFLLNLFRMKELAAYLLLLMGGKTPDADSIEAVVTAAGGEVNADVLGDLLGDLEGKDLETLIAEGKEKLKTVSMGGGGGGGGGAAPAAAAAEAPAAKPKEEEVDALDGGMDMFGGGGSDY